MRVCNCSLFCCLLFYVHSSIEIILNGTRELVALLNLSSWCLAMAERLFLAVLKGCLRFVMVVFPDHTHLLFLDESLVKVIRNKLMRQSVHKCQLTGGGHLFVFLDTVRLTNAIFKT